MENTEVLKFGSSVLRDTEDVPEVARVIAGRVQRGFRPIVVVSAMGDQTDYLMGLAERVSPRVRERDPALRREMDMLVTAGERVSMALLAIALNEAGVPARSFTGSQVGIVTDTNFGRARIKEIKLYRITEALRGGWVPVVAGFQGVSTEREVTTLGRGGSDLTAVALASSLSPPAPVKFYKDVGGVYALEPKRHPGARLLGRLSYNEALEMSFFGARVVHPRALALAARQGIELEVKGLKKGETRIDQKGLESPGVSGVVSEAAVLIVLQNVPRDHRFEHQVVAHLAEEGVEVLLFSHGAMDTELIFVVREGDRARATDIMSSLENGFGIKTAPGKALVSLVGYGIGSDPGVYREAVAAFSESRTHIDAMATSEVRLSFLIDRHDLPGLEESLAKRFDLKEGP